MQSNIAVHPSVDAADRPYAMAVYSLPGIGCARSARLHAVCGSFAAAWRASMAVYNKMGLTAAQLAAIESVRQSLCPSSLPEMLEQHQTAAVFYGDASYPQGLAAMHDPPLVVYIRGEIGAADQAACAIVGTRRASPYGRWMAQRIAGGLARAGITIVSGLATGIDATAHEAALGAGGRTIAVLAGGFDTVYPPENVQLAHRMLEGSGAWLSEYLPGTATVAGNFLARNRLISGLSLATIVAEAGRRSGALSTARFALEQGRDVCAVPGRVGDPGSAGVHRLLRDGAHLVESSQDVLLIAAPAAVALLRRDQVAIERGPGADPQPACGQPSLQDRVLQLLSAGPLAEHHLLEVLDVTAGQLRATLALLELDRRVERLPGAVYLTLDIV